MGTSIGKLLVLVLYLLFAFRVDFIHELLHSPDYQLHSRITEANPCHRVVYHHEPAEKCGHKTHIIKNDKCLICLISQSTENHLCPKTVSTIFFQSGSHVYPDIDSSILFFLNHQGCRAPPTFIA